MRLYVLLVEPAAGARAAYACRDGLVRSCSVAYAPPDAENRHRRDAHLCNTHVNSNACKAGLADASFVEREGLRRVAAAAAAAAWRAVDAAREAAAPAPRANAFQLVGVDALCDARVAVAGDVASPAAAPPRGDHGRLGVIARSPRTTNARGGGATASPRRRRDRVTAASP